MKVKGGRYMSLFKSRGKKSAAVVFGNLNHSNNNQAEDLQEGTKNRYQQISDAQYAAKVLGKRLKVVANTPKYHLVKSK